MRALNEHLRQPVESPDAEGSGIRVQRPFGILESGVSVADTQDADRAFHH